MSLEEREAEAFDASIPSMRGSRSMVERPEPSLGPETGMAVRLILASALLALCACAESRAPEAVAASVAADGRSADEAATAAAAKGRQQAEARGSARFEADLRWATAEEEKRQREKAGPSAD